MENAARMPPEMSDSWAHSAVYGQCGVGYLREQDVDIAIECDLYPNNILKHSAHSLYT